MGVGDGVEGCKGANSLGYLLACTAPHLCLPVPNLQRAVSKPLCLFLTINVSPCRVRSYTYMVPLAFQSILMPAVSFNPHNNLSLQKRKLRWGQGNYASGNGLSWDRRLLAVLLSVVLTVPCALPMSYEQPSGECKCSHTPT
jgi:hypothetical protein